jgi:SAM-dependent methyltransferase
MALSSAGSVTPAPPPYDAGRFWEGILSREYSLIGVGHGGYGPRYNSWLYRAKEDAWERALAATGIDVAGKDVLDSGAGTGYFTARYGARGARVTGADITPTAAANLARRFPSARIVQADLGDPLPFTVAAFDLVHCLDVLYHITDDTRHAQALDNLSAACRPGGFILLNDGLWRRPLAPARQPGDVPHVIFRPRPVYDAWIARAGLSVLATVPMYYLLNRPIVGDRFPWTSRWLSWHLRHRLCESPIVAAALYAFDTRFARYLPDNPSLKILVLAKPAHVR